jgi:SAM-dependent methyltransferase
MTTMATSSPRDEASQTATEDLVNRLIGSATGALEMFGVYLGRQLGLYDCLSSGGALDPGALAAEAGIAVRYAREWLEQQAVAGFLTVDDAELPADERRYALPAAHRAVLVLDEHPALTSPIAEVLVGVASALPDVLGAFRGGGGVPYARYGADLRRGRGALNRPVLANDLARSWLPAIPDLRARLAADPPARIADLGCGVGWSTIALARACPRASVTGYDLDQRAIVEASAHASDAGVSVSFARRDASSIAADGPFDLVLMFQTLHEMARPTEVLALLRRALAPGGSIVVVEHRVADRFVAPGGPHERLTYGFSVAHGLPAAMADAPSDGLGTVIRCCTVERCAHDAGLARFEVLPIESPLLRFFRLRA